MVYSGSNSLQYISAYDGTACTEWWCALCNAAKVSYPCGAVPPANQLAGLGGDANDGDVAAVCNWRRSDGAKIGGYMIWFASADNGFQYGGGYADARTHNTNWNQCNFAEETIVQ